MNRAAIYNNVRGASKGNLGIPFLLMLVLGMVTLPMPPFLLDTLFTFNIALSIVVLLVCVYSMRPLDFAVFPTILLITTLMRLALNVASTRVVLLYGHEGGDAAGKVIEAFGEVVIGGNYVVGLVVFMILVIINFVVVTKGAGRISEVSARFTLDAMPGKQMAIDADLNAGLISQEDAKLRRQEVTQEADFYGSMDGASKFVRGDAVAGILILVINIIGGLGIGMMQHDLSFELAARYYSLLTIGDGLVAQIPSLLLSTAAAIMVTRVNSSQDMGQQIISQLFGSPKALAVAAVILFIMGSIPGMPHVAFLSLAITAGVGAYFINQRNLATAAALVEDSTTKTKQPEPDQDVKELDWDDVMPVDMIGLEVGYRLIPMVDKLQGGQLLSRIKGVRKKLSQDLGFLVPSVHIRDNLDLMPGAYRITLMGVSVGESEVYPDRELAINPGQVFGSLKGINVKDPAFGLDAVWIEQSQKEQAQTLGYTVVDAGTVVATHLNQILQAHSHELMGHDEVQKLLDMLGKTSPKLVEELVPSKLSVSTLLKVLQNLLMEQVPVKDFRTITESLAEAVARTQDPQGLTAAVRISLSRMIVQNIVGNDEELPVITLDPQLEQLLLGSVQRGEGGEGMVIEPTMAERLQTSLAEIAQQQEIAGRASILLVAAPIRPLLAKFVRYGEHQISVLSYQEIPENKRVTIIATVGGQN
ncbi:flagellar biosynthesis protein FlhA [Amphritea sp. 2_MG-2023]|jgi:flagellar biosynthesis protein FlhA|uniref:flagellar biosynthesis protein FlhA n=1 Tax=Amphritea TaxID=515417 RepID=UPI001C0676F5|nr:MULTISPECIES: flagellar biosynthesis protein FlhA [Amphritea]MBU2964808.1 flagellar biosynthesis protein FlhA [Amphritea atlantica]MDO6419617.1 flagellar biosynthesis protein FlhA [Amphritea sp. 2_MG-2023]